EAYGAGAAGNSSGSLTSIPARRSESTTCCPATFQVFSSATGSAVTVPKVRVKTSPQRSSTSGPASIARVSLALASAWERGLSGMGPPGFVGGRQSIGGRRVTVGARRVTGGQRVTVGGRQTAAGQQVVDALQHVGGLLTRVEGSGLLGGGVAGQYQRRGHSRLAGHGHIGAEPVADHHRPVHRHVQSRQGGPDHGRV